MNTKDNTLLVSEETQKLILEKTPKEYIKTRPGPSGMKLSYVEVGYVQDRLNKAFHYLWDFDILEQQIGKKQVWVKGKLTAHISPTLSISKVQYGGIDIKFNRTTGEPVSIADDMKAAASDALKKCASMFGIAQDLYWHDSELQTEEEGRTVSYQELQAKRPSEESFEREPIQQEIPAPEDENQAQPPQVVSATMKQKNFIKKLRGEGKIHINETEVDALSIVEASRIIATATAN